jgi:F420-non-reducing hydrogenase large subunit
VKALDAAFNVEPPSTAKKLRELMYAGYLIYDHILHFYYLGGPDFIVGPDAPPEKRNILGVIEKAGMEVAKEVIKHRAYGQKITEILGGKATHPVCGLPGGISKALSEENRQEIEKMAASSLNFAKLTLNIFHDIVLGNSKYVDMIKSDAYTMKTYYMGLVDENNKVNFYDGKIRVVDPTGKEFLKFEPKDYITQIGEHVEEWSYAKFPYLKKVGWARLIELLYATERALELVRDPEITSTNIRAKPGEPGEGVGVVEAARGTLYHHYTLDKDALIKDVNMIVATTNNYPAICMSVRDAAKGIIHAGKVDQGMLNRVEMAFRAYDPCFGCATHFAVGQMPLTVQVFDQNKKLITTIRR